MQIENTSVFWDSMLFVAAGIFLMFFYRRWTLFFQNLTRKNAPTGEAPKPSILLSTGYIWLMRVVGLISLVFGGVGVWFSMGGTISQ
jgi:hypothetical protein